MCFAWFNCPLIIINEENLSLIKNKWKLVKMSQETSVQQQSLLKEKLCILYENKNEKL